MGLNKEQQAAVDASAKSILLLAAAGSGKTYTLIERITKLIHDGADPRSILVLTFTNAAAFEMKTRFMNKGFSQIPEFRTFHAFCYKLLRDDPRICAKFGFSRCPDIATEEKTKSIETTVIKQYGIKLSEAARSGKKALNIKEQQEYLIFMKAMDRALKLANLITFDRLCYGVCELFLNDDDLVVKYKNQYKHILIDEFQDTDPRQMDFAMSFKDSSIFLVADVLQAIYGFRGADSSICKKISEHPENAYERCWQVMKLPTNYRSDIDICKFANNASVYADSHYRIMLVPNSEESGHVEEVNYDGFCSKYDPVPEYVLSKLDNLMRNHEGGLAILARTNKEVDAIKEYATNHRLIETKFTWVVDTCKILDASRDIDFALDWLASRLNADNYAKYITWKKLIWKENWSYVDSLSEFVKKFGQYNEIYKSAKIVQNIHEIFQLDKPAFDKCVSILKLVAPGGTFSSFALKCDDDIVTYIKDLYEESNSSSIYIGTIHSSKGLEYDSVALVGVGGYSFRLTNEANNNLYYVGITRAKHNLTVFTYDTY